MFLSTRLGNQFHFTPQLKLTKIEFELEDIAYSLARTVRFNGHTAEPYTVAAHIVNFLPHASYPLEWLIHEVAEAYIGDVPGPIKNCLPNLGKLEKEILSAFRAEYDLPKPTRFAEIATKSLDEVALLVEAEYLFLETPDWHRSRMQTLGIVPQALKPVLHYVAPEDFLNILRTGLQHGKDFNFSDIERAALRCGANPLGV